MNLNTARIFVRDIAQAKRFYTQTLGLKPIASSAEHGYCVFTTGGVQLVVEAVSADAPQEEQELVGRFTGLSFTVADIQQTYRSLSAAGVAFTGAPERQAWGGILATLRDPAGNELQVVQPAAT
ncbi:MAG: VOC family protein [Proteobacteria bacterium]|nr:VOC family protein [Pseudomonadota bacterium]